MARLDLSLRLLVFLALAMLAPTFPVRALAQSNDITLSLGGIELAPATYPTPKILYLEAIKEQVPVFEGSFRITQDVTVGVSKVRDGARALFSATKTVSIVGELRYQACDRTTCYPPTSVPVKWELQIRPLDLKRSPKAIQHK